MSLVDGNGMGLSAADVAAVTRNNGSGFGWGGDGAWWLIILLLFGFNNGWGNGGFGGNGYGMFPYMMSNTTQSDVQRGFDQSAIINGLNSLTSALSTGFSNAEVSRCNAQANLLQTLNANQNAMTANVNSLAMGLQNCCCENRAGLADLKYTVATENCADRNALSEGLTSLMMANSANTQAIVSATNAGIKSVMDKICQLELDGKNERIADLQSQLNEANRLASQAAQTATLEQYLRPSPIPAYIVQNPSCCNQGYYSGCGCGA